MRFAIQKWYDFVAGHRLVGHPSKCDRMHGHSYRVHVVVRGPITTTGDSLGMVLDLFELDEIVRPLVNGLDHRFIVPEAELSLYREAFTLLGVQDSLVGLPIPRTTVEHVAGYIAGWVRSELDGPFEVEVTVLETEKMGGMATT